MVTACHEVLSEKAPRKKVSVVSNNETDFLITLRGENKKNIYFHLWIDRRFSANGEICIYLGYGAPDAKQYFDGTIYLDRSDIKINNFGFFRSSNATPLTFPSAELLIERVSDEIQKRSDMPNV